MRLMVKKPAPALRAPQAARCSYVKPDGRRCTAPARPAAAVDDRCSAHQPPAAPEGGTKIVTK